MTNSEKTQLTSNENLSISKIETRLIQARQALLHGTPEQRKNVAGWLSDLLGELRAGNETKACIWEDCDQEAVYCPGHAREFVHGESPTQKARVSPTNQCDGCRRGLPVDANGLHRGPSDFWGGDVQRCTADRYQEHK